MDQQVIIRSLNFSDIPMMYKAFQSAFSDYTLAFNLTEEKFIRKFIEKLHIDFDVSAGAFSGDEMVGFIFTGIGNYLGKKTAYNGGSGVIPAYRGKGLTIKMYQVLLAQFKEMGIEQCVLEVLTENKPAINAYLKVGFKKSRTLRCFKMEMGNLNEPKVNSEIVVRQKLVPDWPVYKQFADFQPSYLDQYFLLEKNMLNETLLEASFNGECLGYAIYQQDLGRISQFGVAQHRRRSGIGAAMMAYMLSHSDTNYLTILNIDEKERGVRRFLKKMGFVNKVNQYEMILNLQ